MPVSLPERWSTRAMQPALALVMPRMASWTVRWSGMHGQAVAGAHDVSDLEQQGGAEVAGGMQAGEILPGESAALEQHHGQRVAQGERGGRAGRGRQPQGAGLAGHAVKETQIGVLRELRIGVAGEGDRW